MIDGQIQIDQETANQPRNLFKPGSWLAKIYFINHLILFNNVLITVLSEQQGGKTSFSHLLLNNLDEQIKAINVLIKPPCTIEDIIASVADQLHLNESKSSNLTEIVAQINERRAHVLVVIDDAQHLPESVLNDIMHIIKNQDEFTFFHLCLVSDYSIVATLNNLAADQFNNLIHSIELGTLTESETRTYVLQRALITRLINKPLSDAQYKQFYQLTKGNLAKINSQLEPFIKKCHIRKKTENALVVKRLSALVAVAVVAGFSYLYFAGFSGVTSFERRLAIADTTPAKQLIEEMAGSSTKVEQLVSQVASWHEASTAQLITPSVATNQILDDATKVGEITESVATTDVMTVIPPVITNTALPALDIVATEAVKQSKAIKLVAGQKTRLANKVKYQPRIAKHQARKIAQGKYTIQFIASPKISQVSRLKRTNSQFARAKIRHFNNAKGSWYVLTLGEYSTLAQAQTEIKKLGINSSKLKPWIRTLSGLTAIG